MYFLLSILAVWRLTHLLAKEDGPFDIIFAIRKKAGERFWGRLMDCFYCLSIWISLPFGIWLGNSWWEKLLFWMAISGAACLLEKFTDKTPPQIPFYKED
ncbi:MAG TPA: DUF1360 domain-containing protein [Niabella sp.]|mgnify:CR=1 FL=1|nr:DUF1360 domain-containing protein [Niabella sp.]HOZ98197.1 DUF1360 domain-containing protein [Niabella sp.]HQW16238.1 DUF1360 domain-containing protein [Niabella sp.]HQX21475.1 DUF1360 domain-containing protein [Niabella sp.]HRB08275.1 DUF1360 domain-containing protein [Niabella sp.]